jgi:protocadherin alpha
MDLSFSMNDDLTNLKSLGIQLAERIQQISNNFTVGFGSFVDKQLASFINLDPRSLLDPCRGGCLPTYSYRHVVTLTEDDESFSNSVNEQRISGNQDFPEGGFDGFLQSIVCTDMIGWRDVSRKILLYISDAGFHFAGDGLLGGVVKPNDGQCHMGSLRDDGTRQYEEWDTLDYPSIGQIAEKLDEFDIIPIFAVVRGFQDLYSLLRAELGNRAYLGELASNSNNVVDLVEQLYLEISQSIVFAPVNIPGVSVTVTPFCPTIRDGVCTNVNIGDVVNFTISVDVTECTEELILGPRQFDLRVIGFGTVTVNLAGICSCDCDQEGQRTPNATECNGQGTLACGQCECNPGYFGDRCQCDNTGTATAGVNVRCPTGLETLECSGPGRGTCMCGVCECNTDSNGEERFYGIACECDNSVCARGIGNEICSGRDRGECTCDGCQCQREPVTGQFYMRSDCSCTPNNATCFDTSNSTDQCNGRGFCECGACQCNDPYFGEFCELCSGDDICQLLICGPDSDNTPCASCVVDLLVMLNDTGVGLDVFTATGFNSTLENGDLPAGSVQTLFSDGVSMVPAIELPASFAASCGMSNNVTCPPLVIINETMAMPYIVGDIMADVCSFIAGGCSYRYFVAISEILLDTQAIHVEFNPICPEPQLPGRSVCQRLAIPCWAVALIIVGVLVLLGIAALVLLKLLLMLLDYIEVQKFERELQRIKYTKNENPLYHSATKDYKNPIYGQ